IALSFCTSSAYMGDLTSFLALVLCVRSPFFRVKWLILPGQPVTPRKRYSIAFPAPGAGRDRELILPPGCGIVYSNGAQPCGGDTDQRSGLLIRSGLCD